jgi:hypothetical protein
MPSAQLRHDPTSARPTDDRPARRRVSVRMTLTFAALMAGLGGILAVAQATQETVPELVPVSRAHDGTWTQLAQFAAHERAESRLLSYEPARREREGDDDEQDEPRH